MFRRYLLSGLEPNRGALDFSELLDAPAGKHGFLKGRNGRLEFNDGTVLKIIGTSMVGAGCTPKHEVADIVAERLASSGINMVRMHYADGIVNVGQYRPEDLEHQIRLVDYSKGSSRELNETALERLDYFIYKLKERGIYVQLDTFVGRNWMPEGDELDYPDTFSGKWAPKHANIFNRRMIALQKEYQTKLLTHRNPYTGLRYVDDPTIAIVQMMNENSLLWDFGAAHDELSLPPSYMTELKTKWRAWLKKRYGTNETLRNAWTDMNGICALQAREHLDYAVQLPSDPFYTYKIAGQVYEAPQDSINAPARMADYVEFLVELENAFTKEILEHLQQIGVKCGVNATNLIRGVANVYTSTRNCDVQEQDAYYNHPHFGFAPPARVTDTPMSEVDPRCMLGQNFNNNNLITQLAVAQVDEIPLVIAEWNDVSATPFDADAMLEMTAYGCLQDWDGMCNFLYNQSDDIAGLQYDFLEFYFTNYNDPAKWGQYGISSYVFQKGLVKKARNNIYLCYTGDDIRANSDAPSMVPYTTLPFVSRVAARFSEEDTFAGAQNDVLISGGYTPTGNFTEASHAVVFSESPYADLQHKAEGRTAYLHRHAEEKSVPFYGIGQIGQKRLVVEEGRKFSRNPHIYGDAVTEAMRRWGMLEADQGIVNGKYFNSDTGEIKKCPEDGTFLVESEQFAAFAGHPSECLCLGNAQLWIHNQIMAVSLLSRDGKPLTESNYILMTAIGETKNEGTRFDRDWILDLGHAPILVDQIEGRVVIPNAKKSLTVYALKPNGERSETIPVTFQGNDAVFCLDTQEATIHFELRS